MILKYALFFIAFKSNRFVSRNIILKKNFHMLYWEFHRMQTFKNSLRFVGFSSANEMKEAVLKTLSTIFQQFNCSLTSSFGLIRFLPKFCVFL